MRDPLPEEIFPQNEKEFEAMLEHLKRAASLLEIGTRYGETLKRMARVMPKGSRVVSVDIGDDPLLPDQRPSIYWKRACVDLAADYDVHLIEGNSQDLSVVRRVAELGPFDFCLIDADHETQAVRKDWENYGPLCKTIAFHDIAADSVKTVWNEAKRARDHREYVHSSMGIGVLRVDGGTL